MIWNVVVVFLFRDSSKGKSRGPNRQEVGLQCHFDLRRATPP